MLTYYDYDILCTFSGINKEKHVQRHLELEPLSCWNPPVFFISPKKYPRKFMENTGPGTEEKNRIPNQKTWFSPPLQKQPKKRHPFFRHQLSWGLMLLFLRHIRKCKIAELPTPGKKCLATSIHGNFKGQGNLPQCHPSQQTRPYFVLGEWHWRSGPLRFPWWVPQLL